MPFSVALAACPFADAFQSSQGAGQRGADECSTVKRIRYIPARHTDQKSFETHEGGPAPSADCWASVWGNRQYVSQKSWNIHACSQCQGTAVRCQREPRQNGMLTTSGGSEQQQTQWADGSARKAGGRSRVLVTGTPRSSVRDQRQQDGRQQSASSSSLPTDQAPDEFQAWGS
jgi:hypothetical protein